MGLDVFPNLAQKQSQQDQLAEQKSQTGLLRQIVANQNTMIENQRTEGLALAEIAKLDAAILVELQTLNKFFQDELHPHLVAIGIIPNPKPTSH